MTPRSDLALKSNHLTIERISIDLLKPLAPAVRRHTKKQMATLQRGLERFGQVIPIPITPDYEIIDLEAVWRALKANGASHVDVTVVHDKTPAELKALRLALNRTALDGTWDDQNLRAVLEELIAVDFELDLTGFSDLQIDCTLNLATQQKTGRSQIVPQIGKTAVTTTGTMWALGNHRIVCGSAIDHAVVNRTLGNRLAAAAFVDPSNILNRLAWETGASAHLEPNQSIASDSAADSIFQFFLQTLRALHISCSPAAAVFAHADWRTVTEMNVAARMCGLSLKDICVWTGCNRDIDGVYSNAHQLISVYINSAEHNFTFSHGRRKPARSNVWPHRNLVFSDSLPADRPVALIADALRDVTKRGDYILDPFLGIGSTLMAAHKAGRICCGIEMEPLYVDIAVRRWQDATGYDAISIDTGRTFNETRRALPSASVETEDGAR